MRANVNENFALYIDVPLHTHTRGSHISNWNTRQHGTERERERALLILYTTHSIHTYIYNIYIHNYTYMIWFRHCVCMVNQQQQHYRRRVCDFVSLLLCYSVTTVCLRAFYWHTCFHTFAAFFKLSFILWPLFIVVAIYLPHLLLHWPYIRAYAHTNTNQLIYMNTLPGYLLLLDLVFSSLFFLHSQFTFMLSNGIYSLC